MEVLNSYLPLLWSLNNQPDEFVFWLQRLVRYDMHDVLQMCI
jgi:hypothetical protein